MPDAKSYFYGELSLDGSLRHTKGTFLLALSAKEEKVKNIFVPKESANEAGAVGGIDIYPIESLGQLILHLNGIQLIKRRDPSTTLRMTKGELHPEFDFSEIIGQEQAKRALMIAAAGGHNIFMQGPP